jgi:SMC interacting uncharacterized protein involved in chromosome segregation
MSSQENTIYICCPLCQNLTNLTDIKNKLSEYEEMKKKIPLSERIKKTNTPKDINEIEKEKEARRLKLNEFLTEYEKSKNELEQEKEARRLKRNSFLNRE